MKLLQCMRKNKLNLYLDIKTLLLFFRDQLQLRSAISGSSHLRFRYGKATICIPLSVTFVCFSTGDTKYIYPDEILELEQVKELLTMAFQ